MSLVLTEATSEKKDLLTNRSSWLECSNWLNVKFLLSLYCVIILCHYIVCHYIVSITVSGSI